MEAAHFLDNYGAITECMTEDFQLNNNKPDSANMAPYEINKTCVYITAQYDGLFRVNMKRKCQIFQDYVTYWKDYKPKDYKPNHIMDFHQVASYLYLLREVCLLQLKNSLHWLVSFSTF